MGALDWGIVGLYGAAVLVLGMRVARGHQAADELWLGGRRVPTWAVLFSMVATELSAATFIGVPEIAYRGDWSYLQFAFGALAGKAVLASLVIPLYHRLGIVTVYGLLEHRFGPGSRRAAALCFVGGRVLASGVRLFIAALAFAAVADIDVEAAILVCGAVAGIYTLRGGIRSVIYTDVLQGAVFCAAGLALVASVISSADGGFAAVWSWAAEGGRSQVLHLDPILSLTSTRPFLVGLVGGFFLTLATHGTDHDMVQRLLAARSGRAGGRALLGSALLNFPLTALFLFIGTGIAFVHQATPTYAVESTSQILPLFALHELPAGMRGLVYAGILAAAMSSFDSAVCAITTTWVVDVARPAERETSAVTRTRRAGVACCGALLAAALGIAAYHRALAGGSAGGLSLVDLALSAMTILYGGLLGVFGVAVALRGRGSDGSARLGLLAGAMTGALLFLHPVLLGTTLLAWPWWIPVSASLAAAVTACAKGTG